ncbi:MAG: OmpA family protein [Proteobacteria bacterium]|nr:OmpA family protein [Pseudomonadota bacterium]
MIKCSNRTLLILVFQAFALLASGAAYGQDARERMFRHATEALETAKSKDARRLAPDTYARGMRSYKNAEKKFSQGRTVSSVQKDLAKATIDFEKAQIVADLAAQRMGTMIKAHSDAAAVNAKQYSTRNWTRAQAYFRDAVSMLEDGRQRNALRRAAEATKIYRELELEAIKGEYLTETRMLLAKADKMKAKRYAPITLRNAKNLLASAEVELTENRYDTDRPRSLAREAQYEARHAIHLTEYLKDFKSRSRTQEQLILHWEKPLQEIAAAADMQAKLDQGYETVVKDLVEYLETGGENSQELGQQILERDREIVALTDQVNELSEQLGGVASAQEALRRRLAAQEVLRQRVVQIESTFERTEANVFRDSNEIYIRLVGLSFDSGSSNINSANYGLLRKVENAIEIFPSSRVIIEGHTDSFGGDDQNYILSEKRSESVRQYLLVQMGLSPERISSIGYGETKPVANNETPQGRAKNRRIDIRIVPNLDLSQT